MRTTSLELNWIIIMKKLNLILVSILLFVYVSLSLLSSRGDYCAERELWGINRKLGYIASHRESTPDYTINQLANRYRVFIKKYNGSIDAKSAQLMIGNLYSLSKNFPLARLEYQKAVGQDKELSAQAEWAIARTYELEGHWDKASAIYKSIIQDYPLTSLGFSAPLYLASHLAASGAQMAYTDGAYRNALEFYQRTALKYPKSKLEYNALRMMAICHLNQKDWSSTVKTMGEIMMKYPTGKTVQEAVNAINLLCVTKLHDYGMGINIYQKFIQRYPDHLDDPLLKKMVKDLQLLKNKKLIIQTGDTIHTRFSLLVGSLYHTLV